MDAMHKLPRLFLSACLAFMLVSSALPFDPSLLDEADRQTFAEINAGEVLQALAAKAVADNALTASDAKSIVPVLTAAQAKGLPLAALIYPDWMHQDQMRKVLTAEFKRSEWSGGITWKHLPRVVDVYLIARDPPDSLYFHSDVPVREQMRLMDAEGFFRDTLLANIHNLVYPDPAVRPPRGALPRSLSDAPFLKRMLETILASPTAVLSADNRKVLEAQIEKVDAFIANPPPLPVAKWREVAAKEKAAENEAAKQISSPAPAVPKSRSDGATPAESTDPSHTNSVTKNDEPTSSIPWPAVAVVIAAAIGLLWLALKKRE